MNWALVLSRYPRSLLTDERPLLVLSVLERAGLATEHELVTMTDSDEPDLKSTLLTLQLDNLVEYRSTYIRITDEGRRCLERFRLDREILDDVLDSLALKGRERARYSELLEEYRTTSFRLYLNSLCSLRQWWTVASAAPGHHDQGPTGSESRAGMRALLLRDLRNWILHYPPARSALTNVDASLQHALTESAPTTEPVYRKADQIHNNAVFLLHSLSSSGKTALLRNVESPVRPALAGCFHDFHVFQASWEPDTWFDKWLEIEPPTQRFKSADKYLATLGQTLEDNSCPAATGHAHGDWLSVFYESWAPDATRVSISDNLVSDILAATDIGDLCRRTGLSQLSAKLFLSGLGDACSRLLETESKKLLPTRRQLPRK